MVDANNRIRELKAAEKREVIRILQILSFRNSSAHQRYFALDAVFGAHRLPPRFGDFHRTI